MDPLDNSRAVARELVSFAREQGVDLEPFCNEDMFIKDRRWIWLWRKDSSPGSGRPDEPLGILKYNMQGTISVVPNCLKESASAFRGDWSEAGTFEDIEQAFQLVKAWLLDWEEVDDPPSRSIRRYQI
jgi:hypothetical protein